VNYYGLVRPEFQARQSFQSLQTQVGANNQAITELATGGPLPGTGKTVGFMTHGSYFQNFRPSGGVGGGLSAPSPTRR
jgi:hypothetical protein